MEEADFFSDDDLNQIADHTLLELEQHAITSTQKPLPAPVRAPLRSNRGRQAHNASSLHRGRIVNNNIPWRPPQKLTQAAKLSQALPELPSQHESYDDENVIDLAEDIPVPGWSQSQAPRPKPTALQHKSKPPVDSETAAAFAAADAELSGQHSTTTARQAVSNADILEARIAALEAEAAQARTAEQEARRALESKVGEVTIVRANAEREKKEHDRKILMLQKGYAEEAAKHRSELEAGRKEREKMQTDNRFLQHDLAQEADRAKRANTAGGSRIIAKRDTPKKLRKAGLGDGFDDNEVLLFSPSRSRGKDSTPRAGAKRKRTAQDSPIASLSFAKPAPMPRDESTESAQLSPAIVLLPSSSVGHNEDTKFIQRLLVYQPLNQSSAALELLCQHHIPSIADKPLSTLLMEALSTQRPNNETLPVQTVRVLTSIWQQCLDQQHLSPLTLLVDLILFALRHEVPSRYNKLAQDVVPLCLRALEIITMPIVRAHLKGPSALAEAAQEPSIEQIDGDQLTALLEQMCLACSISSELIGNFWRMMRFTNSLLLLHKALPYERIMAGLRILYTSALDNSFGAISQSVTDQDQQERDTVFRLTFAFFDIPAVPTDEPPYDEQEIARFRIMVLGVLTKLCESDHGSLLLASHTHFIGRLVRFVDEQVRKLYSLPPSQHESSGNVAKACGHELVVKTINMSMRILHYLLTTHGDTIDLSDKFSVVVGGYHKFLISMTRLAFIEQPTIFEDGIEEEVIDAAHSILDAFLTPEDGEAVAQALETPQASKGADVAKQQSFTTDDDAMDTDTLPAEPD